jgi:hypothetical protein
VVTRPLAKPLVRPRAQRSINSQLGNVACTIDVAYAFHMFFALALRCALSVSAAEQSRVNGRLRADLPT